MERTRCAHCGHPSPPPSPALGIEEGRKSPVAASWPLDSEISYSAPELDQTEPHVASPLYRPLWDLFGLTVLTVASLLLYFFLSPGGFPWWTTVSAFWITSWTVFQFFRTVANESLTWEQKKVSFFDLHVRFAIALCVFCIMIWMGLKLDQKPWFFFVLSGAAALLTIHYAIAFIDWKRMWLFPQLQIYLNICLTCFMTNTIWSPTFAGAWWLWPTSIGGLILIAELIIFFMITKRRIRLSELDPEDQRRSKKKNPSSRLRTVPSEVPLLVDFSSDMDTSRSDLQSGRKSPHNQGNMKTPPPGHRSHHSAQSLSPFASKPYYQPRHESPTPLGRGKGQMVHSILLPPIPPDQFPAMPPTGSHATPLFNYQEINDANDTTVTEVEVDYTGSTPLVEYVSTPSDDSRLLRKFGTKFQQGSKAATGSTTAHSSKPISMRVVHHDDHNADVLEGSLAGSEGIYIDVVRIPEFG